MSEHHRTTRRRAIQIGSIGALAAGLLGTTTTTVAQPAPLQIPTVLPAVVSTEDLAADCDRLLAELKRADAAYWAADAAMLAMLAPEQYKLHNDYSDAMGERYLAYNEWISAEMARHAPGLSTVIRLLWLHAIAEGTADMSTCCTPATSYEP
jgi:hypothetical protein